MTNYILAQDEEVAPLDGRRWVAGDRVLLRDGTVRTVVERHGSSDVVYLDDNHARWQSDCRESDWRGRMRGDRENSEDIVATIIKNPAKALTEEQIEAQKDQARQREAYYLDQAIF